VRLQRSFHVSISHGKVRWFRYQEFSAVLQNFVFNASPSTTTITTMDGNNRRRRHHFLPRSTSPASPASAQTWKGFRRCTLPWWSTASAASSCSQRSSSAFTAHSASSITPAHSSTSFPPATSTPLKS